jgi:quercetin dioxygenase-like cupin family protein
MKLERIPWTESASPRERELKQRLEREGFETYRWDDPPGAWYEAHSHDRDECLWCIEGEITFGIEGSEYTLGPGDRLMLPKGTVHTARAGRRGASYWIGELP